MNKNQAAIKIQSLFRGYASRKKTNIFGASQGKEVELYIPLAIKKKNEETFNYHNMFGGYKYLLCTSDLFSIQIDFMNFDGLRVRIPEIVTAPFRSPHETHTNLPTEQEIDDAVNKLISIIESFVQRAVAEKKRTTLSLETLINEYNASQPKHPLSIYKALKSYLANPVPKVSLFGQPKIVKHHQNVEICFAFDPDLLPEFDAQATPRTLAAKNMIDSKAYRHGQLLMHVQKTYSIPLEQYNPRFLSNKNNPRFHNTEQQLSFLDEARTRAELLLEKHPLPTATNRDRVLGLLTICAEHVLTVVHARDYVGLHEKADFSVLSIRHTLHYVKKNCCNQEELRWFDFLFHNHREDIYELLCHNEYIPDYRGNLGRATNNPLKQEEGYDVIFDLFGNFANGSSFSQEDLNNPLSLDELNNLAKHGITSWCSLFNNHVSLLGRTHLPLQKVAKERHPLFEARRIGLMTPQEFREGKSQIYLNENTLNFSI